MDQKSQNEEGSFVEYKRSVREKATGTIHELRHVLDHDPVVSPEDRRMRHPTHSESKETLTSGTEHSDYSYSAAVGRLRDMLHRVTPVEPPPTTPKTVIFAPPQRVYGKERVPPVHEETSATVPSGTLPSGSVPLMEPRVLYRTNPEDVPGPEETIRLLQNEALRIQQLESEKKFLNEEMHHLRQKILEIVEENRVLHEELRRSVVHELTSGGIATLGIGATKTETPSPPMVVFADDNGRKTGRFDYEKWRFELEKIHSLHQAKTARLETQLQYAKDELQKSEAEADELRRQMRQMESFQATDPSLVGMMAGLCIKCAASESVLPPSVGQMQKQNLDSLIRDRDDLMAHVALLKTRYEEMRGREEDLYLQVKASSEMVEQSQMEMTQALIEREQLREELLNAKGRLEEQMQLMGQRIADECELVRKEGQSARVDMNSKTKELLEKLTETQILLDKTSREKVSVQAELEIVRGQLSTNDLDYGKATESMRVNLTQAALDRNLAMQQMERVKQELDQSASDRHAERMRLKQELEDLRRRLHQAEKELLAAKEQCIELHNSNQALEREVHLTKLSKESLQRSLTDDLVAADKRAELRETELSAMVDSIQNKHARKDGELEEYSKSQATINQKLREECGLLVKRLEEVTHKYKGENRKLKSQNEQLTQRLERTLHRCKELQDQHSQQGLLQEKMRERLQEMDKYQSHTTLQLQELLAKESILMRERRELCRHVEFLQRELICCGEEDKPTVYFGSHGLVDGILKNVRNEEIKNKNQELTNEGDNRQDENNKCQEQLETR